MIGRLFQRSKPSLEPAVPLPDAKDRLFVVGDVHGRSDLLEGLLSKLEVAVAQQEDDRAPVLVFLGDYIDRGDNSREVLEWLLALQDDPGPWAKIVFLRGNHEAAVMDFVEDPTARAAWLGFGGKQTLGSYGIPVPRARPDRQELHDLAATLSGAMGPHLQFLEQTEVMYRSGDVICAHSGIDPEVPLDQQTESALLWGRSDFLEEGPPPGLRVVHGHWDNPEEVVTPARICVDTGAYYSGRLTAVQLDEDTQILRADVFDL